MKLLKRTFVELPNDTLGHVTSFEKNNGNTYYVFYVECRYSGFQEVSADGASVVSSEGIEPFRDYSVWKTMNYE